NIRSLIITPKGKIIGVVGQNELLGQIFTWENGVYDLVGWVRTAVMRTDYNWYASDLIPCVYMPTGTIMFGNAGRIGKLISWYNN
ncbi:MAG: hypothetical protein JNL74_16480, partial [Fibrobacteres bacterium]|nr:hypothetical protein [Fibrobacterota bacterium]